MTKLPRLDELSVAAYEITRITVWDRVFNSDEWDRCVQQLVEKLRCTDALNPASLSKDGSSNAISILGAHV